MPHITIRRDRVIRSADTERLARGIRVGRFQGIERVARRKLRQLHIASAMEDLRIPPGNRLEKLKGDREGQYGTRINDPYRVCFTWTAGIARNIEIVDYH